MVLILVLVLVALLLIVALAIIAAANTAGQAATSVSVKYRVLNSAEGAENLALNDLENNPAEVGGTHFGGSLNGVNYDAWIETNNLGQENPTSTTDPATNQSISVPQNSAYIYGVAADQGGHTTYVEAIAGPAPPLTLPPGAVNAGGDVLDIDPMPIYQSDLLHANDATVSASADILVSGQPSVVQGLTSAGGTDQLPGSDNNEHSNNGAVTFPLAAQVALAGQNAKLIAEGGSTFTGEQIAQNGTREYDGNVYVSDTLNVASGTVKFAQGTYVYINGNLCISGSGQVLDANLASNEIVVAGSVEVNGGSYAASPGQNTLMLVLGNDAMAQPCSASNTHAVDMHMASSQNEIGTIYAPSGSIALMGSGSILGAVDAGADVMLEGTNYTPGGGMQYDLTQAQTTMPTGALTYNSYFEY
jgi:hypothetical protein